MAVSIDTKKLQDMVAKASKGVGNNKLIPLTSMICIQITNNELTLITTDATNYLYVKNIVDANNFYVVVDADKFTKLVSKMTCDSVTLDFKLGYLEIKGNGTYKIEIPLDENGQAVKYPDPYAESMADESVWKGGTFKKSHIQVILDTIQPSLAVTLENPCYTGFYMHDKVVATDTYKIASMATEMFNEPKLVSREFLNLVPVIDDENIKWSMKDDVIILQTANCVIYGRFMEGLEEYAIGPITELIESDAFSSSCKIPKDVLLQLLNRLELFVGTYDKNSVHLTFTNEGLQISSKSATGVETVPYIASDNFVGFTCAIDIQMLTEEVKAVQGDVIELYYGDESSIKFKDGNVTIIIALMEDDEY